MSILLLITNSHAVLSYSFTEIVWTNRTSKTICMEETWCYWFIMKWKAI